jgi:hypothetical protein
MSAAEDIRGALVELCDDAPPVSQVWSIAPIRRGVAERRSESQTPTWGGFDDDGEPPPLLRFPR